MGRTTPGGSTPHDVAIERIRQLRKRHAFTQQDLADRLNLLGAQTDRAAVAKVELGKRGLSLNELFQYAMALDVAPVHLVSPPDSDEPISLGPNMTVSPDEMRAWVKGDHPLAWQDVRTYYSEVPEKEFREAQHAREAWEQMPWRIHTESDREEQS
jgi:transcriptional regulator with XRE-family HTH domain